MGESKLIKKTLVFIVIGIFLGAGAIPAIGNTFSINSNNYHTVTVDDAMKVAYAKLNELSKNDYSIVHFTQVSQDEILLYYVFELNPQGYIVVYGSFDLPPVIAYSFTSSFQDPKYPNILHRP